MNRKTVLLSLSTLAFWAFIHAAETPTPQVQSSSPSTPGVVPSTTSGGSPTIEVTPDEEALDPLSYDPKRRMAQVGFDSTVSSLAMQPDGKILVGGNFTRFHEDECGNGLTRLKASGRLDTDFVGNVKSVLNEAYISTILVLKDGRILAGGSYKTEASRSAPTHGMVRLLANGHKDTSFPEGSDGQIKGTIETMALQDDGKILVGGDFIYLNGTRANGLLRLHSNGRADVAFSSAIGQGLGFQEGVDTIVVQPDGKILVSGHFRKFNDRDVNGLVRLNEDGTMDTDFYINAGSGYFLGFELYEAALKQYDVPPFLPALLLQPDGNILRAGEFVIYDDNHQGSATRIIKMFPGGTLDMDYIKNIIKADFQDDVNSLALTPDGKLLVGCIKPFTRLSADGLHDKAFLANTGYAIRGEINAMLVDKKGKIIIGGEFPAIKGVLVGNIARINKDGTLDENFVEVNY